MKETPIDYQSPSVKYPQGSPTHEGTCKDLTEVCK